VDVLGVGVHAIDMPAAVAEIGRWIEEGERRYVCVTGVHGVMESRRDEELRRIHNESGLTTPDGMPMVWACRYANMAGTQRVYGPDLLLKMCARGIDLGWSHYFYGGKEGVPELLAERLVARFPGLRIAGGYSPPFRPLTATEEVDVAARINATSPDIVWVGLSTPKQERWMAGQRDLLKAGALVGVGAAFDIHAGLVQQAPHWMQVSGLEWLFRMGKEPRRLARRYLRNNPAFVAAILKSPPRARTEF